MSWLVANRAINTPTPSSPHPVKGAAKCHLCPYLVGGNKDLKTTSLGLVKFALAQRSSPTEKAFISPAESSTFLSFLGILPITSLA